MPHTVLVYPTYADKCLVCGKNGPKHSPRHPFKVSFNYKAHVVNPFKISQLGKAKVQCWCRMVHFRSENGKYGMTPGFDGKKSHIEDEIFLGVHDSTKYPYVSALVAMWLVWDTEAPDLNKGEIQALHKYIMSIYEKGRKDAENGV